MPGIKLPDKEFNQLSRNDRFLKELDQTLQSNLSNEQFGVEQLAQIMSISRVQLYRRLHKINGKNVSQYIREYRLKKAYEFLKLDVASASEIAYQVGFSSPSYFNKCFHDLYGFTPGSVSELDIEDEDSKKIKPIFSGDLSEDETSIHFKSSSKPSQKSKKGAIAYKKQLNEPSRYFNRRIFYTILFFGLIGITIVVLWKYFPYLNAPVELTKTDKFIAVLPFKNLSPDPENDYFCKQVSEEIRVHLQKINDLRVKGRIDVEQYEYKGKLAATVGAELGVSYILDGSVQKIKENLRITVVLIEVNTGEQIWSKSYDGLYSNEIFDFQSNVARDVSHELNAVLTRDEEQRLFTRYTDSLRSYDLTIMGEYEMAKILNSNSNDLEPALKLFNEALEIDPENVKALVNKGKATSYLIWPDKEVKLDSVRFFCNRAIEHDPEYPEAYFLKANSYHQPSTKELAIEYYLKTIELAPSHAGAYSELGNIYVMMNQEYAKGLYYLSEAKGLNVNNDPAVNGNIASCLMHSGFYDKSKDYCLKTITSKDFVAKDIRFWSINNYAWILFVEQRHQEAYVFLDTMVKYLPEYKGVSNMWQLTHSIFNRDFARADLYLDFMTVKGVPPFMRSGVAWFYQQTGRDEEATAVIEGGIKIFQERVEMDNGNEWWAGYFHLSSFYTLKGDKEKAIEYFARSIDANGGQWGWPDIIETNPTFEDLWDEPEFKRHVQRSKNKQAALHKQILEMQERGEINL
jgi:TolB-like protein/AraC-like DNA-binding protein